MSLQSLVFIFKSACKHTATRTVMLLVMAVMLVPTPALAQSDESSAEAEDQLQQGFSEAIQVESDQENFNLTYDQRVRVLPVKVAYNSGWYTILGSDNCLYKTTRSMRKLELVRCFGNTAGLIPLKSLDIADGCILVLALGKFMLFDADDLREIINKFRFVGAHMHGEGIIAINRTDTTDDKESLVIEIDRQNQIISRYPKQIGVGAEYRNLAATYTLRRLGSGGHAVFSPFTGEILPRLEGEMSAKILTDPLARKRAEHNMNLFREYLENLSVTATYVNVIDDVVGNENSTFALCYTDDQVYLKQLPRGEEQTRAYSFPWEGQRILYSHMDGSTLHVLVERTGGIGLRRYQLDPNDLTPAENN